VNRKPRLPKFLSSFEFGIICVICVFVFLVYALVQDALNQPTIEDLVWDEQFDQNNLDDKFVTPFESYEVDLSLWRPVPDRLRGIHVSVVRQTVIREVIRKPEQGEYLFSLHTSGLKPDFACLTHNFIFTKDYSSILPDRPQGLRRYTARVDINREPVNKPIRIELLVHSWNAYQGRENQMFGVYAKPGSKALHVKVLLPKGMDQHDVRFERYDAATKDVNDISQKRVRNNNSSSPREVELRLANVKPGDGYFVYWAKN